MSTTVETVKQTLIVSGDNPPDYGGRSDKSNLPAYNSLSEELKCARQNSKGRGEYLRNVCDILSNTSK